MILLEDVHVTFGRGTPLETQALRGVDLSISEGEFVTLIGSNGAGKSTLLGALTGDAEVERGRVVIDGVDVTAWSAPARAALVARVFQDPLAGTCDGLSIEQNLALALARGRSRGLARALEPGRRGLFVSRLTDLGLGLERRLREPIGALSGGQRQALSLVMATLAAMKILLLDEHTAALDPRTAAFVLGLTDRIVEERGLTTLMVTHSMRQALDHGTRTVMLHEGRVAFDLAGERRRGLDVPDLLALFHQSEPGTLADDRLLIG